MIVVTSLKDHANVCESIKPSHLISVIDPGFAPKTPLNLKNHLKLGFDDIIEIKEDNFIHRSEENLIKSGISNKQILPNYDHINQIIEFFCS